MIPLLLLSLIVTASDRKERVTFECGDKITFHVTSPGELDAYVIVLAEGIEDTELTAWHRPEVKERRWGRVVYEPIEQSLRGMTECGAEFLVMEGEMEVEWEVE